MKARHIPNLITVGRFLLIPPVTWFLLQQEFAIAIGLFLIAAASDGVDGFLARRFGWQSRLGQVLDPLADKALMLSVFVALTFLGLIPVWLMALMLVRDIGIVGISTYASWLGRGVRILPPTLNGKVHTFMQAALAAVVLAAQLLEGISLSWQQGLVAAVAVTTLASGLDYGIRWFGVLRAARRG